MKDKFCMCSDPAYCSNRQCAEKKRFRELENSLKRKVGNWELRN